MFRFSNGFPTRRVLLAVVMGLSFSTCIMAGQPSQSGGLGQSWPQALDVSLSPHWHVYVFERDGVRYIQVNDLHGTVRGAFASVDGEYIALPMGHDAQRVSVSQQPSVLTSSPAETVYTDGTTKVTAAPQNSSNAMITAAMCDKVECGGTIIAP